MLYHQHLRTGGRRRRRRYKRAIITPPPPPSLSSAGGEVRPTDRGPPSIYPLSLPPPLLASGSSSFSSLITPSGGGSGRGKSWSLPRSDRHQKRGGGGGRDGETELSQRFPLFQPLPTQIKRRPYTLCSLAVFRELRNVR